MAPSPQEPGESGQHGPDPAVRAEGLSARPRGRKRRFAKRWTRRVGGLAIAILAAVFVTVFTVDIGRVSLGGRSLKTIAESRASAFLERPMHIGRLVAYLTPGKFALEDVVIDGPTPDARSFFVAGRITVEVPWWTIFRRELYVDVRLYDWRMVAEKFPDGKPHFPRLTPKPSSGKPFPLKIRGLSVYATRGEFIYDDHVAPWRVTTGRSLQFSIVRANNLNTYVGLAEFRHGTVQIQKFQPMATDFVTRFQLDGSIVRLKHLDLTTDGSVSHISGFVNFGRWPDQEYRIQSTIDFNRMRQIFFHDATWRLSGEGRFNGIFRILSSGFDLSGLFASDEAGLGVSRSEWRFNNLEGALQWTPSRFVVSRADADFLGGRLHLAYGLNPLGTPAGATATLAADYASVDLYRFTRQFGWTALEPQGRMHGRVQMAWRNGQFTQTMQGQGETTVAPPEGRAIAAETLPAGERPPDAERPFQKFRPFGEFAIGAEASYRFSAATLDFDPGWVATPSTFVRFQGRARGDEANLGFHVTSHDWQNSDRLFAAIMTNFNRATGAIDVGGRGTFDGVLTRSFSNPRIEGEFSGDGMRAWGVVWGGATGRIVIDNSYLDLTDGRISYRGGGRVRTAGRYALGYPRADQGEEIRATIEADRLPLAPLRTAFGLDDWPVDGVLAAASLTLRGAYEKPSGSGTMRLERGTAWQEPFDAATGDLVFDGDGSVRLQRVRLSKGAGLITGTAWLSWAGDAFSVVADSDGLPVEDLNAFRIERAPLTGVLRNFKARGSGSFGAPVWQVEGYVPDLYVGDEGIGALSGRLQLAGNVLTLQDVRARSDRLQVGCAGTIALNETYDTAATCQFAQTSLDPYFKFVGREVPFNRVIASGSVEVNGPLKDTPRLAVAARVDDASLTFSGYQLRNDGPVDLAFRGNAFRLVRVRFRGEDTSLELGGTADLTTRALAVSAAGQASLGVLQAFYPTLSASGGATLAARLDGTFDRPVLSGRAEITNGRLRHQSLPHGLSEINGPITIGSDRIAVDGLRAVMGEGPIVFTGGIQLSGYRPQDFDLHAVGESLHLRYPEGLQSTVRAALDLTGPVGSPVLSGTVDVLRASYLLRFQPERGYFGLIGGGSDTPDGGGAVPASAAEPFPLALAIKIRAPITPFVDNKAANAFINASADVEVTGTIDHPVITGRVNVVNGEWIFSGYRYRVRTASIDFTNPLRFDPFFELTAETRVRTPGQTYQVTVRVNGTLDKLNFTLNSEPWLSETQILSLLFGETADINTAELRALASPQDLQAKALSAAGFAILTSPFTATVGSAVQRATTVTAQIVPLLGNEANLQQLNPTARIILGKRISDRVYLTYSRTLTGAQNEIILVEFDQNDQISWVLSRNEDRSFALDFRLRYIVR